MLRILSVAAVASALAAGSAQAGIVEINAGFDALASYNLITAGNLSAGHDVEGRAFIGGSVVGNSAFFNMDGLAGPTPGLTVVGDVNSGGKANVRGDITVGGKVLSGVEFQGAGADVLRYGVSFTNTNVNSPDSAVQVAGLGAALATQRDGIVANLGELSGYLKGLSTTDAYTSDASNVYFNATSTGDVAVFSIADLSIFANKSVQFAFPTAYDLVVVNVTGSNSMTTPGGMNFNGPAGLGTKVIWNFANLGTNGDMTVDKLTLNNAWYGSILAIGADASNNTAIEGSMAFRTFNQGGEVHTLGFGGYVVPPPSTTPVPEPAAWALMILGFGAAGAMLRRRRASIAA